MNKERFTTTFEQETSHERGFKAAQISLDLGMVAMNFARIDRAPRYADGERENDAEHSYMLGLVAPEVADALKLDLDRGLIVQFAMVHDLVELKTGDIATFLFSESDQSSKELSEMAALDELLHELPPYTRQLLARYETQADPEARFVRYIDKLLPIVIDIIGAGERVMREDYGVDSLEALEQCQAELHKRIVAKFGGEFPELDLAHKLLCEMFEFRFEQQAELAN